jgi:hypothetical protein
VLTWVAAERLGIIPDEIASGHCAALSQPRELADMRARYAGRMSGSNRVRTGVRTRICPGRGS